MENPSGDDVALDLGKPNLDLVKPGGIGRCEMDPYIGISLDKLPDPGGAMGREIICNNVNLLACRKTGHDLFQESNKFGTGVTRRGLAQHPAGFGVERGVEGKGAVTIVLKTMSLGSSRRERQDWVEPVQSLDGALFVDAKDSRIDWRLQIQAKDVRRLGFKIREQCRGERLSEPRTNHLIVHLFAVLFFRPSH